MSECRILFLDSDLREVEWCLIEPTSLEVVDSGQCEIDGLRNVIPTGTSVTVFVPQQHILMTGAQLPPRAGKQQLGAIGYAVEEHIAGDVDDCFFAIGQQQEDHRVPVAVVELSQTDKLFDSLQRTHLNIRAVLPQLYLCPYSDGDEQVVSVCPDGDGFLPASGCSRRAHSPSR